MLHKAVWAAMWNTQSKFKHGVLSKQLYGPCAEKMGCWNELPPFYSLQPNWEALEEGGRLCLAEVTWKELKHKTYLLS